MTLPWRRPGPHRSAKSMGVRGEKVGVSQAIIPREVPCHSMMGSGGGDKIPQAGPQENRDHGGCLWANMRFDLGTQRNEGWES